jgi:hypothetical protein
VTPAQAVALFSTEAGADFAARRREDAQANLERMGWRFDVWFSEATREFFVIARSMGVQETFHAPLREHAVSHALGWALVEQERRSAA